MATTVLVVTTKYWGTTTENLAPICTKKRFGHESTWLLQPKVSLREESPDLACEMSFFGRPFCNASKTLLSHALAAFCDQMRQSGRDFKELNKKGPPREKIVF